MPNKIIRLGRNSWSLSLR